MSLPKASPSDIEYVLRSGGSLNEEDPRLSVAKDLGRLGMLHLSPFHVVKCALEGDPDFDDLTEDQIDCMGEVTVRPGLRDANCPICGRRISVDGKKVFANHRITLEWLGIARHVRRLVVAASLPLVKNKIRGLVLTRLGETVVRICIPEACESDVYVTWYEHFADPILYIVSNTGVHRKEYPTGVITLTLGKLLTSANPSDLLSNAVKDALELSKDTNRLASFTVLLSQFERHVRNMTPSGFEEFVGTFLENVRSSPAQLEAYRRKLSRRSHSLLGALIRVIGGSGAEDIMVEPKVEYLANLFSGSGTHEMKKYTSRLNLGDLSELMRHCEQRGTPGILFTSADRVSSSVWDGIRSVKATQGSWKYIVIDRNLFLELLIELRLTRMLSDPQ